LFDKVGFFNGAGKVLFLTCNIPYVLVGSQNYICRDTGEWEGMGYCRKEHHNCYYKYYSLLQALIFETSNASTYYFETLEVSIIKGWKREYL